MTKKEAEALKDEIAELRKKVEALEKEPRKYEFHYHPPLFVNLPTVFVPPQLPWHPLPWSGTLCGPASGIGPSTAINRIEACVN